MYPPGRLLKRNQMCHRCNRNLLFIEFISSTSTPTLIVAGYCDEDNNGNSEGDPASSTVSRTAVVFGSTPRQPPAPRRTFVHNDILLPPAPNVNNHCQCKGHRWDWFYVLAIPHGCVHFICSDCESKPLVGLGTNGSSR